MPSDEDRTYIIGETVVLTCSVSSPNTRAPEDADAVVLDAVVFQGVAYPDAAAILTTAFTHLGVGYYELAVQTAGWAEGVYTWRAKATDGGTGVVLKEDTFVLRLPS